jgi:Ras-related protein Rab-5C
MYYRNADAAVLVYDLTDPDSFEALQSWYHELQKNVPDCIIVLCGNKLDMDTQRKVMKEHAQEYATDKDCPLIEVSSKTGDNIQELFLKLGAMLTQKFPG